MVAMIYKSPDGRIELRCGRWQDVLSDVERCDAVICDPPFGERTHKAHDVGVTLTNRGTWKRRDGGANKCRPRSALSYDNIEKSDCAELCASFADRCTGWFVVLSCSDLIPSWRGSLDRIGLTTFQPLPCVIKGMTVRLAGDGPSSWAIYANVARPKALSKWGTLPGAYITGQGEREYIGSKPLALMRALVRDYTRHGDLIVDPYAGSGTTLLAAAIEGRRAIGAEMDPKAYALAVRRLKAGYTPDLFK